MPCKPRRETSGFHIDRLIYEDGMLHAYSPQGEYLGAGINALHIFAQQYGTEAETLRYLAENESHSVLFPCALQQRRNARLDVFYLSHTEQYCGTLSRQDTADAVCLALQEGADIMVLRKTYRLLYSERQEKLALATLQENKLFRPPPVTYEEVRDFVSRNSVARFR